MVNVHPRPRLWALILAALALLVASCRSDGSGSGELSARPSPGDAAGTGDPADAEGPTTATADAAGPPSSLPLATTPSCPPVPARRPPDPNRPRYVLRLDVQPAAATVTGTVDVRFIPDLETDRLEFRLWPNGPRQRSEGARMDIGAVEVDGKAVATTLDDPTTLVVPLPAPVPAGQPVQARVAWTLQLPREARDRISADGEAARLGSFFPLLEWEPGVGWVREPPTTRFAEASTAPTADFDITVTAPPGLTAIASGRQDRPDHWTATAMRDVAVAVGRFTIATGTAQVPEPVQITVGVDASVGDSPQPYVDRAKAALEDFSRRFGPYPWPTLAVSVTPTISTGIEYPGHLLHGRGTSGDVLTHEVAHQWFYSLVGNNQGRDPWLDEALTTWAEARFEGTVEKYRADVIPAGAQGRTTAPMTFWDQRDDFYLGAYVQGAQALAALGEPDLVDCALRIYAAQNAYRIARPADLVAATSSVFPDSAATLARFGIRS